METGRGETWTRGRDTEKGEKETGWTGTQTEGRVVDTMRSGSQRRKREKRNQTRAQKRAKGLAGGCQHIRKTGPMKVKERGERLSLKRVWSSSRGKCICFSLTVLVYERRCVCFWSCAALPFLSFPVRISFSFKVVVLSRALFASTLSGVFSTERVKWI